MSSLSTRLLTLISFALLFSIPARADAIAPLNLTPDSFGTARQPQIAVSPSGVIYVVFGHEKSIYFTSSTDHGQAFSVPARIADVAKMPLGMRRGPRIAATDKRLLVTAPSDNLLSYISDDNGKTWSTAIHVNDKSDSANEGLDNIAALPDGSFYAVWLDFRGTKVVKGARLDAGGADVGNNVTVYQSPDKSVCDCCHPSVVVDAKGKLTVMWRNSVSGNRDIYLAESTDRGDTFSPGAKLGDGSWKMNACPMDGGNLVATPEGVVTVWRRLNDVYMDKPGEPEKKMGAGAQPVVTEVGGKVVWIYQDRNQLAIGRDGQNAVERVPGSYPAVVASNDGKEAYLVWENPTPAGAVPQFTVIR